MVVKLTTQDLTSVYHQKDVSSNGSVTPRGDRPVGFFYSKNQNGADYPKGTLPPKRWGWRYIRYLRKQEEVRRKVYAKPLPGTKPEERKFVQPDPVLIGELELPQVTWVPQWRQYRNKRKSINEDPHNYSMTLSMWHDEELVWSDAVAPGPNQPFTTAYRVGRGLVPGWSDPWTANDDLRLLDKLREKIVGSDFDLATFMGEGHQSIQLVTESATRIYRSLKQFRKGNMRGACNALGIGVRKNVKHRAVKDFDPVRENLASLSQRWLEIMYGWLPLLQDAEGGAQALAQILSVPRRQKFSVSRMIELVWTKDAAFPEELNFFAGYHRARLVAYLEDESAPALTMLSTTTVAWELVPYSFVADWFIPIGTYLEALGLARSLKGKFVTTHVKHAYADVQYMAPRPLRVIVKQPNTRVIDIQMTRSVSSSLSVPLPEFKPLGKALSIRHCLNAIALLGSRFGSGSPPVK